jgi:arabinose-5-phosphate isomerase
MKADITKEAINVLQIEAEQLLQAINHIDDSFKKSINIILKTKGKLIITGVGKSGLVGAKMAATFSSTGTSSFFIHPTEAMHGDLGMISKNDTVLAISYSGESDELLMLMPHIKRLDIPLIAMSGYKNSTLVQYSDSFINTFVSKEACPMDIAPTSSTTVTLAIGDSMAVVLMKLKEFKKEDFASFHPGGSLGKKLFLTIDTIMRKKNLPIITNDTSLQDAIIAITKGKIGNAIICDKHGKLKATLSDGDLRRALEEENFSLDKKAIKFANKSPKYITKSSILASDALKMIEDFKIQLLIVTDRDKIVKGVLHIHDLIEAGIE